VTPGSASDSVASAGRLPPVTACQPTNAVPLPPPPASARTLPRFQIVCHDSNAPCSAGKATPGAAAEPVLLSVSPTALPLVAAVLHRHPAAPVRFCPPCPTLVLPEPLFSSRQSLFQYPMFRRESDPRSGCGTGLLPSVAPLPASAVAPSLLAASTVGHYYPCASAPCPALFSLNLRSQIVFHDSKTSCSAGEATHGAAAEPSSPFMS